MFDPALICTDLSDTSDRLIACTGHLAALGVREAVLAHTIDAFGDVYAAASHEAVERQCRQLEAYGIDVKLDLSVGYPAFTLADVAKRHKTRMTVIASNGKGLCDAPFSGSVSSDIVLMSETPVLVAPSASLGDDDACSLVCSRLLAHPLIAIDFSDASLRAFDAVAGLADRIGRVTLLHVRDIVRMTSDARRNSSASTDVGDRQRHELMCGRLRAKGLTDIECRVEYGNPPEVIAAAADSGDHTLVVVGGHSGDRSVLGSVSDRLLTGSSVPVLVVP